MRNINFLEIAINFHLFLNMMCNNFILFVYEKKKKFQNKKAVLISRMKKREQKKFKFIKT